MINDQKIFTCGKYKDTPLSEVMLKNYDYLMWLKDQDWISKHTDIYEEIKDLKPKPITMPWGKFKGKTIKYIFDVEYDYFKWLRENEIIQKNKKVWAEICKY
jgi:hypothetical protein